MSECMVGYPLSLCCIVMDWSLLPNYNNWVQTIYGWIFPNFCAELIDYIPETLVVLRAIF